MLLHAPTILLIHLPFRYTLNFPCLEYIVHLSAPALAWSLVVWGHTVKDGFERKREQWIAVAEAVTRELRAKQCYVDGPYGTPTRRIFTSEQAVLIGAGIGITPFASLLQSIMYRYRRRQQTSSGQCHLEVESRKNEEMKLQKDQVLTATSSQRPIKETMSGPCHLQVDFIWINRDQKSFEWFVSLLTQLEMEQAEADPAGCFLEMHLFMTSALRKNDVKAVGLQMALDLLAQKEKRDAITGLKTRTQPGRPNWNQIFRKLAQERRGKVHVFFCGSPALAKVVRGHCEQFGFRFFKEHF
uniref:NADPH oxidase 5 n=1 Tax=Sphaerodactylus townsendi TaxID=933632 RepID=A0ACB8E4W0_9SAUR